MPIRGRRSMGMSATNRQAPYRLLDRARNKLDRAGRAGRGRPGGFRLPARLARRVHPLRDRPPGRRGAAATPAASLKVWGLTHQGYKRPREPEKLGVLMDELTTQTRG